MYKTLADVRVKLYRMKSGTTRMGVTSPYHYGAVRRFKELGGSWSGADARWYFDPRDRERVEAVLDAIFGHHGDPVEVVTVRYSLAPGDYNYQDLFRFGRQLARRYSRDTSVRLGEGVIVEDGRFPLSGGSVKNPCLGYARDCPVTLLIRDVPVTLVDADRVTGAAVEVVEEPPAPVLTIPDRVEDSPAETARRVLAALSPEERMRLLTEEL